MTSIEEAQARAKETLAMLRTVCNAEERIAIKRWLRLAVTRAEAVDAAMDDARSLELVALRGSNGH